MTVPELDGWLRGQLAELEGQRPGAARPGYLRGRWGEARAAFAAATAERTGLPGEYVGELLERRDQVRRSAQHSFEAWRLAADDGFVAAVMAAAAWTKAAARPRAGRPR
jgi:hypothetical protein